jgi:regulator of RNase E activity RraA
MYGFKIHKRTRKADAALVAAFKKIAVANISDEMHRTTAAGPRIRPMHAGGVMAGVAITVKTRPGDNLLLHKAIDLAGPGDIIVCDGGGDLTNSLMGEIMLSYAMTRGIDGFVLDGSIRDAAFIRANTLPVFAAGITHRGPYKDGPGEINVPIAIDGMVINPGDIIVGDDDGVLAIPFDHAEDILKAATAKQASEVKQLAAIAERTVNRSWVDEALRRGGCVIEE